MGGATKNSKEELTKGSSRMVELMCRLYHVSFGGDQGNFLSGGASA